MDLMDKKLLGVRVYKIAEGFGLEASKTHEIVTGFLGFCRDQLADGYRVTLLGLVTVVPYPENDRSVATLAYDCSILADKLGYPQYTVYCVVRAYIDSLIDDILDCKNADLRGIVNIHPIKEDGKLVTVHSNISATMSTFLRGRNSSVESVRVHTHPLLKRKVKEARGA